MSSITFEERPFPGRVTKRWAVVIQSGGKHLGEVKWYPPWQRYCFFPDASENVVLSQLDQYAVYDFCERQTKARKEERSVARALKRQANGTCCEAQGKTRRCRNVVKVEVLSEELGVMLVCRTHVGNHTVIRDLDPQNIPLDLLSDPSEAEPRTP